MCGIAAVFGRGPHEARLERMLRAIAHRGPDDAGAAVAQNSGGQRRGALGHRRLAIIDLSPAGHQPMWTADGAFGIVFNGEIYNYRELREELRQRGESFVSDSDTEVILAGWRREGIAFADRLQGMFAFVLWDRDRSVATLVRDSFGIKPLYVADVDGAVVVASEIRAMLSAGVDARLSGAAIRGFLATGSVPEPLTALEGVLAVPAGSFVEIRVGDDIATRSAPAPFQSKPWWTQEPQLECDRRSALRRVRDALEHSIARHLVSDVPVAAFLSGGIDSSAVVALAARHASTSLDTFTVTFDVADFDESAPARSLASRFGTRHHEVPLSANDLLDATPLAFAAMDQPSIDGLNTFVVSRAVRGAGMKVVLSGLGGDEMFGGYPSFRRATRVAALWRLPAVMRHAGARVLTRGGLRSQKLAMLMQAESPAAAAYHSARALFASPMLEHLIDGKAPSVRADDLAPTGLSTLQTVSWLESSLYMRNTLLRDSDVFSMAHGLELRVPFVDREVAAAAASIADELRVTRGISKPLLVGALEDMLPREVWDRPKQGFTLPFAKWMRGELQNDVGATLMSARRVRRAGLQPDAVRSVWTRFLAGQGISWSRPWALYTLVRWSETVGATADEEDVVSAPELVGASV